MHFFFIFFFLNSIVFSIQISLTNFRLVSFFILILRQPLFQKSNKLIFFLKFGKVGFLLLLEVFMDLGNFSSQKIVVPYFFLQ